MTSAAPAARDLLFGPRASTLIADPVWQRPKPRWPVWRDKHDFVIHLTPTAAEAELLIAALRSCFRNGMPGDLGTYPLLERCYTSLGLAMWASEQDVHQAVQRRDLIINVRGPLTPGSDDQQIYGGRFRRQKRKTPTIDPEPDQLLALYWSLRYRTQSGGAARTAPALALLSDFFTAFAPLCPYPSQVLDHGFALAAEEFIQLRQLGQAASRSAWIGEHHRQPDRRSRLGAGVVLNHIARKLDLEHVANDEHVWFAFARQGERVVISLSSEEQQSLRNHLLSLHQSQYRQAVRLLIQLGLGH